MWGGDGGEDGLHDLVFRLDGEGKGGAGDFCAPDARGEFEGVVAGVVFVMAGEDFIAGAEAKGADDGVDPDGGVSDEGEVVGVAVDEGGHAGSGGIEERFELFDEEADGLGFHAGAQADLEVEDRARRRAEGAVVEEDGFGVEREVFEDGRGGRA